MSPQNRRAFLKRTGGVVGAGGALAAGGLTAAEHVSSRPVAAYLTSDDTGLPPLRGPYADEDWVEHRGNPGNTGAIDEGPSVDPDDLACTCFDDGPRSGTGAIVEDTMYVVGDGRVRALDAHGGSVQWTSDDVGAAGTPSLAYHRAFVTGSGAVTAVDVEDRSVAWETAVGERPTRPTVAHGTVFVVSDGTLYALDVADGTTRWKRGLEEDDEPYEGAVPAVSDGRVYAIHGGESNTGVTLVALDALTGERLWGDSDYYYGGGIAATDDRVAALNDLEEITLLDPETGDSGTFVGGHRHPALDDEALVGVDCCGLTTHLFDDGESWDLGPVGTGSLGPATVAGDTVYVYVGEDYQVSAPHSLIALDTYDGEIEWTCEVQERTEGLFVEIAATRDAVYVFDREEIHVVHDRGAGHDH